MMTSVRKMLKADELVHEQVLGLDYTPVLGTDGQPIPISVTTSSDVMRMPDPDNPVANFGRTTSLEAEDGEDGEEGGASGAALLAGQGIYSVSQVKQVMVSLTAETSFLVDARLRETLRGLPEDEQEMYKVRLILPLSPGATFFNADFCRLTQF